MEVFVGRQPIFDRNQDLFAYELLYRGGNQNHYNGLDHDSATADVIVNGFINIGFEKLSSGKLCFINFTENLLIKEIPTFFSPDQLVVEILENIEATEEIVSKIELFKQLGYTIALDDFIVNDSNKDFIPLADIIKVDFIESTEEQKRDIVQKYKHLNLKFLAEKVETIEEYNQALEWGYDYFQGYFFSKPVILSSRDIHPLEHQIILILNEINKDNPNMKKISNMFEQDLALTYKLLKLINSAAYQLRNKITSVNQAIILLGLNEIRKWLTVMMFSNQANNPQIYEVLKLSLIRAKFAEKIAFHRKEVASEYFLLGMFSLIDTMLHRPIEEILEELPLSENIKEGLILKDSTFGTILKLIHALEKAELKELPNFCEQLTVTESDVFNDYAEAIDWTNEFSQSFEKVV